MDIRNSFPLFLVSFLLRLTPSLLIPLQEDWWDDPTAWMDSLKPLAMTEKRSPEVVPDWPICPTDMDRVDCFYTYLERYIRLRQQMKEEPTRTIGKRFDSRQSRYGCPNGIDLIQCLKSMFLA